MSAGANRKEAVRDYKMRKISRGIFAIRCATTGQTWVDSTPNLDGAKNGTWFQLREGRYRDKALQSEWNTHGEPAFQFEILETLEEDVIPLAVRDLLTEKKKNWAIKLDALVI